MSPRARHWRRLLRSTALYSVSLLLALPPLHTHAFNPDEGHEPQVKRTRARLPSTAPLVGMPKLNFALNPPAQDRQIPLENTGNVYTPVAPTQPSAAPSIIATPPAPPPLIAAPLPVAKLTAPTPASEPSLAALPVVSASANAPAAPGIPGVEPLSDKSKKILSHVPSKLDSDPLLGRKSKGDKLAIKRMNPETGDFIKNDPKVETFDATGISIKVRREGLDTNFELNRAYNALMGGNTSEAAETYKNILSTEPSNEDALFGVASIYHRAGDLERARPYYARLLKVNPQHREGLNNFLIMVSDEAPQEALAELERLEQRNPRYSPIPAQQAVVLTKLGFADRAKEKMVRAIELSPENLTYKYNLAIMLDRSGDYADAAALYRLLIDASLKGAKIPSSLEALQKRLNFIASANPPMMPHAPVGS